MSRWCIARRIRKVLAAGGTFQDGMKLTERKSMRFVLYLRERRTNGSLKRYHRTKHLSGVRTSDISQEVTWMTHEGADDDDYNEVLNAEGY